MLASAPALVIVGPTGAGKSSLAIRIAATIGGEVLSADSQQVYRGMDIGTGKVTTAERAEVRHHLIDIAEPDDEMTAAHFLAAADEVILDAQARGVPLIVAGGTMLYVRVLLRGIFPGPGKSDAIRARLEAEAEASGVEPLWQRLVELDAESAERIGATDLRRIVRALEVYELTGEPLSAHHRRHNFEAVPLRFPARLIGLSPPRQTLYQRITARVEQMFADGLLGEVEALRARGFGGELRSQQAIGYAEIHAHLDGQRDLEGTIALIQRNSRRYARRQLSWYRRDPSISWYEESENVDLDEARRYLSEPGFEPPCPSTS